MSSPYADENQELLGWHNDMPNDDYHSNPGLSKSSLDLVNKSIQHLVQRQLVRTETPAMVLGTAVHSAVLEPDNWPDAYMRGPNADARSKEWLQAAEIARKMGDTIMKPADYDKVELMADQVHQNHDPVIKAIKAGQGIAEGSLFTSHPTTGMLLKVRPDYILPELKICADLKTTMDASPAGFASSCGKFRYDVQAALYTDCLAQTYGGEWTFVFIAVENRPPWNVAVYTLGDESLIQAQRAYNEDIRKFINWHEGYSDTTGYQAGRQELEIPRYFRRNQ